MVSAALEPADLQALRKQNDGLRDEISMLTALVDQKASAKAAALADNEIIISEPTSVASSEGVMVSAEDVAQPLPDEVADTGAAVEKPVPELEDATEPAPREQSSIEVVTETLTEAPASAPNALQEGVALMVSRAQEGLQRLEQFCSPVMMHFEPIAKAVWEKVLAVCNTAWAGCQVLLTNAKAHCDQTALSIKEAMKPLEPGVLRAKEAMGALGQKMVLQYKEVEPHLLTAQQAVKSRVAVAGEFVATKMQETNALIGSKTAAALEASKACYSQVQEKVEPSLTAVGNQCGAILAQVRQQCAVCASTLQAKFAPLLSKLNAWLIQTASCMCAPFAGAIAYRGMASSEYPESVEAPDARTQ